VRTTVVDHETALVALEDEPDAELALELRRTLRELIDGGCLRLAVDLGDSGFVSSLVLGALIGAMRHLRPRGGQLRVVCSNPGSRRVFELTMLDRALPLYDSVDAALARWRPGA
jgi:anti-sigma B factor antagonist